VHGTKGVYELVYFVKESKSIDRFRRTAEQYDRLVEGKSDEEIERLVSSFSLWNLLSSHFDLSIFDIKLLIYFNIVLEDIKTQCSYLWS